MVKAIVRINAFLNEKQTKDVYNLIYDQLKAGLEVITVPSYCDVYILNLNGEDVEVHSSSNKKTCKNCKFYYRHCNGRGQCFGQKDAPYVDDNESCDDFKFEKTCATCKHMNAPITAEPCFSCIHGLCDENTNRTERWEAKE